MEMMRKPEYTPAVHGEAPMGFSYYGKNGSMTPDKNEFGLDDPNRMSPCPYASQTPLPMQGPMTAEQLAERDEFIGAKYNKIFDQYMKKAKAKLDSQISHDIAHGVNQIDR